jgi:CubicO group peptidase (beta-lactamase class C family)
LREVAPGTWHGEIAPLKARLFMTMHVVREADGSVRAFLRDPLFNLGRRFGMMRLACEGRTVRFVSDKAGALRADLDSAGTSFALHYEGAGLPPLRFVRTAGALPAIDASYRQPRETGDEWIAASASHAGIAVAPLVRLTREIETTPVGSPTAPAVQSITIARHGKLVFDRYFEGFDEATPHDTRSAGKTFADVLVGAAIAAGAPLNAGTPLLALYRYPSVANDDPRKRLMTLGDALSMSTGLDCDDNDDKSIGNEDNEQSQTRQPDWYKLVLDARMVRAPGAKAVYCSASINLAGGAVARATHAWLPMFFAQHVAEPLTMQRYALNLTPNGDWYLGGGAYVRPRDMLKIGQLFLDGGRWHGTRVIDRDWIPTSWKDRLPLGAGDDYGYAWHLRSYIAASRKYRAYEAQGNGGQILDVVPQLDLAVMMTAGNYNNFLTWGKMRDRIMLQILAATSGP